VEYRELKSFIDILLPYCTHIGLATISSVGVLRVPFASWNHGQILWERVQLDIKKNILFWLCRSVQPWKTHLGEDEHEQIYCPKPTELCILKPIQLMEKASYYSVLMYRVWQDRLRDSFIAAHSHTFVAWHRTQWTSPR
jgi:hypothetical protein